jgi:hypothetical protein
MRRPDGARALCTAAPRPTLGASAVIDWARSGTKELLTLMIRPSRLTLTWSWPL